MIDLDALTSTGKETLMHGVHGHRHIIAIRMPVAIRTSRPCDIGLRLYPLLLTVLLDHRASTFSSHLQGDTVGVRAVGCMAVKATAWYDGLCQNSIFIEGVDVSLIDADVAPHLIAGLDATIGQAPVVESVFAHEDRKVLISRPLTVFLHADCHFKLSSLVLFCQLVPVVDIEISTVALSMKHSALAALNDHIHAVDRLISKVEVQWCDIGRYRHTDIIGIDRWQLLCLCRVLRSP